MTAAKVIDASAICALLFGEPEAEEIAGRIAGARLLSPTLLDFELANVCWKKCRRDPQRQAAHLAAYRLRDRLAIETLSVDHAEALTLALQTGLRSKPGQMNRFSSSAMIQDLAASSPNLRFTEAGISTPLPRSGGE